MTDWSKLNTIKNCLKLIMWDQHVLINLCIYHSQRLPNVSLACDWRIKTNNTDKLVNIGVERAFTEPVVLSATSVDVYVGAFQSRGKEDREQRTSEKDFSHQALCWLTTQSSEWQRYLTSASALSMCVVCIKLFTNQIHLNDIEYINTCCGWCWCWIIAVI